MLDKLVIGAVRGAINEVVPGVVQDVAAGVAVAHATPAAVQLPEVAATAAISVEDLEQRILARLREQPEFAKLQAETASIPWWRSQVVVGGLIAVAGPLLAVLMKGAELGAEGNTELAAIIGGIGGAIALYGRIVKGTAQPVTMK